jgi:uncharacterized membrane protein
MNTEPKVTKPLTRAGLFLGVGLGGFVDGIVFHQLLQLHGMLTARFPKDSIRNLEINMFWDGVFHAFTWAMTAAGLLLLWRGMKRRDVPQSGRSLAGSLALGWGLFNLVEGIIDHHVLHLHHVTENDNHLVFDLAFLASGLALVLIGGLAITTDKTVVTRPAA